MRFALPLAALLALAGVSLSAPAEDFPSRPIHLVNPFPPGGPLDIQGRLLSERMSPRLGQPVIVENKPGAAGNVGAAAVAKAAPDGYTVLLTLFNIVTVNPHLYKNPGFDPLKDFAPITALTTSDSVLIANPSAPGSLEALIEYARANPGKLNYASAGNGTPGQLWAEYFRLQTNARLTHVPYKGNAEAIRSVLAGETQVMFTPTTVALPQIRAGRLKALAIFPEASSDLPGVPALKGFDRQTLPFWYGLLAPAGTPKALIARLHDETVQALHDPQSAKVLAAGRFQVIANTPEEFAKMIQDGYAAWGKVVRETGVTGE